MPENLKMTPSGKMLHIVVTGKLTKGDYDAFVLQAEQQIREHGKICVLSELHHFRGWTAGAAWEDLKFASKHWKDYERLAIVGDTLRDWSVAFFSKPFTSAPVKYFNSAKLDAAKQWIKGQ